MDRVTKRNKIQKMSDFAYCLGLHTEKGKCSKRNSCERYVLSLDKKNHSFWQSWTEAIFVKKLTGTSCDLFIHLK